MRPIISSEYFVSTGLYIHLSTFYQTYIICTNHVVSNICTCSHFWYFWFTIIQICLCECLYAKSWNLSFLHNHFFIMLLFFTFLEFHYLLLNIFPLLTVLHLSRIRSFQFPFISVLSHSFEYFFDYDNTFTFYSKTSSSLPLSSFSSITQPCHSLIIF